MLGRLRGGKVLFACKMISIYEGLGRKKYMNCYIYMINNNVTYTLKNCKWLKLYSMVYVAEKM